MDHGNCAWAMLLVNFIQSTGNSGYGFISGGFPIVLFPAFLFTNQWMSQSVRIVEKPCSACASRTEFSIAQWMVF